MKYFLLLFIFFFITNCSLNKVSNLHGTRFIEKKFDDIVLNKTNKNDLRKLIGPLHQLVNLTIHGFILKEKKQTNLYIS